MKTGFTFAVAAGLLLSVPARAQHEHQHHTDTTRTSPASTDHAGHSPDQGSHDVPPRRPVVPAVVAAPDADGRKVGYMVEWLNGYMVG
jgi:hypothetical protein